MNEMLQLGTAPNLDPRDLARRLAGKLLIDGRLEAPVNGKTFPIISPATRDPVADAARADAADVDRAVAAAHKAQKAWGKRAARERGAIISECGRLLTAHVEELGRLLALETGKALRTEGRIEAGVLADVFTFYGGLGSELKGETVPFNPNMLTMTLHEPIGVVGAILPWNVPLLLMALKIVPALVAGNAVVVKSAEEAPFAVLRTCEIISRLLPAGLINVLSGFGEDCGAPLVAHPDVGKVTFTGSVETGRIVYRTAAEKLIPVTLELGGKSPMIICEDAELDRVVDGAMSGMRFTRQGQSCTAASRIYVHQSLCDEFVKRLCARLDKLKIGDPLDEATDVGTIVSQDQFDRVQSYIKIGTETPGAQAHACGTMPADGKLASGYYMRPVVFTGLPDDSRLIREEIFGPVTVVTPWSDFDAVLDTANDSRFGLAATIWTRDLKKAMQAIHRLEAGFVQVNQNLVVQPGLSYGGFKQSGLGKEASLEAMLEHFTRKKTAIINML
jgi:acyl-CoA reductase-like NAD-dependent aldehyde dehydrogenase